MENTHLYVRACNLRSGDDIWLDNRPSRVVKVLPEGRTYRIVVEDWADNDFINVDLDRDAEVEKYLDSWLKVGMRIGTYFHPVEELHVNVTRKWWGKQEIEVRARLLSRQAVGFNHTWKGKDLDKLEFETSSGSESRRHHGFAFLGC